MSPSRTRDVFRVGILSVVKHDYVPLGVAAHPRFEPVVVADDAAQPDWVHERNDKLAGELGIPYVRDVERAIADYDVQVAVVSSQAERHCDLSVRAANSGLHIVQDKPMSTSVSECDRVVEAVERSGVKFMMWNRNFMPAVLQARDTVASGAIGVPYAIHVDFYFASDQGPRKGSRKPGDPPVNWEGVPGRSAPHRQGRRRGRRADGRAEDRGHLPASVHTHASRCGGGSGFLRARPHTSTSSTWTTTWKTWRRSHWRWNVESWARCASGAPAGPLTPATARSRSTSSAHKVAWW